MRMAWVGSVLLWISSALLAQQGQNPADQKPPATGVGAPTSADHRDSSQASGHPDLTAPRSDDGDQAATIGDIGESSSKDTKIDLSPPANDEKTHPESATAVAEAEAASRGGEDIAEFHAWDPHKAAKDVEVGDYYFKRKNYRGAESRYREALFYKENDAIATLRLAECLEKLDNMDEAAEQYSAYLKIMPHGPQSDEAQQGLERTRQHPADAASAAK
jgi:Flp pilus assembly protein TadD